MTVRLVEIGLHREVQSFPLAYVKVVEASFC